MVGPPPLDRALRATRWAFAADPATGYQRLASPLLDGVGYDDVAITPDGALAVALRPRGLGAFVMQWRAGAVTLTPVPDGRRATALAVDPEGRLWVGTNDGHVGRLGARGFEGDWVRAGGGSEIMELVFAVGSPRSAVVLAGGEVFTALRPFAAGALRPVTMPERARIRHAAYDDGDHLVVGGDAGAFFVSSDDGWNDRAMPTSGNVSAIGHDAEGALLVAQSNGHVFHFDGTWDPIGQAASAPVAIGEGRGRGVVVVGSDGRMFATLGRDELSEVPGYTRPGELAVFAADIAGDDVALVSSTRLLVFGDALFDSADAAAATPPGMTPREGCALIGPVQTGAPELPTPLLRCTGTLMTLGDAGLTATGTVTVAGARVSAPAWAQALSEQQPYVHTLGGAPVRVQLAGTLVAFERWDPSEQAWAPLAHYDAAALGEVIDTSFSYERDGADLWVLSAGLTLYRARLEGARLEASEFTPVATFADLASHFGCEPDAPCTSTVWALGAGRAVVIPRRSGPGLVAARVDAATPHQIEPLDLPNAGDDEWGGPVVYRSGQRLIVVRAGRLVLVESVGAPRTLALPPGMEPELGILGGRGAIATGARSRVALVARREDAPAILVCGADTCRERALAAGITVTDVRFVAEDRLLVLERGGVVGTLGLRSP